MAADATTTHSSEAAPSLRIFTGADSFGCNLKDALVSHLRSLPGVEIVDLGTDKYYTIAEQVGLRVSSDSSTSPETRGLLACGTGVGVSIFANKLPRVYASTCTSVADAVNTRSINNCNVLCVSGMSTSPEDALKILDAWLQTPFKSPCPASGDEPWPNEIESFLENSTAEMAQIPNPVSPSSNCAICCLRKGMEFQPVEIMPGAEMKIVRESPTSAVVKFKAGSLEPAHHHTFGHDVLVMKGRKKVWNLDKNESYELVEGDYLFTPAGDKHRVNYFEDTEFFIRWDGDWDIFLDESLETAADAIKVELEGSK
ncbi:hypothetical protein KFK09_005222 [Dendrobium nobile]|uniref:ChrR-like cupin domain-containing protein n=1 Tax=Dendrobium nobile TaxID=94219 RepID=A0A8T3BV99_DENNO|nr:hypothetical protein KFK09_005222 [Dendrobium nobile]